MLLKHDITQPLVITNLSRQRETSFDKTGMSRMLTRGYALLITEVGLTDVVDDLDFVSKRLKETDGGIGLQIGSEVAGAMEGKQTEFHTNRDRTILLLLKTNAPCYIGINQRAL